MSEQVDFSERWPTPETASIWSQEIISELKGSITAFDGPMVWSSIDGYSKYMAFPEYFSSERQEPVPYGRLRDLPEFQIQENINEWAFGRMTFQPEQGNVFQDTYFVHPVRSTCSSAIGSLAIFEQGTIQGEFARNSLVDDIDQASQNPTLVSIRDYANLFNSLHDLRPAADKKREEYREYVANMSKEDMRNVRAMKRDWVIEPEIDKRATPKWWGITNYNQAWLVRASSAEEAVLDLEDQLDARLDPLPMVFAEPYDIETQQELNERYADNEEVAIRRLIPFSIIEWPEKPEEMTDEQLAAFDRLESPQH